MVQAKEKYSTRVCDTSPFLGVEYLQRDETERISGETADDVDGAASDTGSRETEKADTVHVGAGEQTLSVDQEAQPAEVRGACCSFSLYPSPLKKTYSIIGCNQPSWCITATIGLSGATLIRGGLAVVLHTVF